MIKKKMLAAKLKRLATEKNISIAAMERYAHCSQGLVSRWAASDGEEFGILSKLAAMADYLGVPLSELLEQDNQEQSRTINSADPIQRLLELTLSGMAIWAKLEAENELQLDLEDLPPSKSGRMFSEGWWLLMDGCYFVLAAYCDDQSDLLEPIEFSIYCVLSHGIPIYPLPETNPANLQTLYIQLRIQRALGIASIVPETQENDRGQSNKIIEVGTANQRFSVGPA